MERAAELARTLPESAGLLRFYVEVARFQSAPPYQTEKLFEIVSRNAPGPADGPSQAVREFCARVVSQAEAEHSAHAAAIPGGVQPVCPFCGEKPVCAVLRPESDGGKRFLLCSHCFTEWEFRRLLCPFCGEEDKDKLPIYTAEQFPYVRVEACDNCHTYVKAIDLTKNGLAVPEVDELATSALDLWADEHGYTKLQVNLFGL